MTTTPKTASDLLAAWEQHKAEHCCYDANDLDFTCEASLDMFTAWEEAQGAENRRSVKPDTPRAPQVGDTAIIDGRQDGVFERFGGAQTGWIVFHVYRTGSVMLRTDDAPGYRRYILISRNEAGTEWTDDGEVFVRVEFTAPVTDEQFQLACDDAAREVNEGKLPTDLLVGVPRRTYAIKTVADVPYGIFPKYPAGPMLVGVGDWCTSVGSAAWAEDGKYRVGAFKVLSDNPYKTERHPLDGQSFPTREAAQKAKYDAGLIGYRVYDDSEWAHYRVYDDSEWAHYALRKVGDTVELMLPGGASVPWVVIRAALEGRCLWLRSQEFPSVTTIAVWDVREDATGKKSGDWYLANSKVIATFVGEGE